MYGFVNFFVRLLTEDRVFSRLLVRELVDADGVRLKNLAHSVLEHPFRLVSNLADPRDSADGKLLTAVSIVGITLGHVQLGALLPYLPGGRPEHADPNVIARHVSGALQQAFHSNAKE